MTKEDNENFRNSTKCWVHDYVDNDVKVRDHFNVTRKYRGSAPYGPSLPILSRVSQFFQGSPDLLNQIGSPKFSNSRINIFLQRNRVGLIRFMYPPLTFTDFFLSVCFLFHFF